MDQLQTTLDRQRSAFLREGAPGLSTRRERLSTAQALLRDQQQDIVEAIDADYGHRCAEETLLAEVAAASAALRIAHDRAEVWMRASRRTFRPLLGVFAGRGRVEAQPAGVVGIVSSWMQPVGQTFSALASALVAGNRVAIRPSHRTPATSALLVEMFGSAFDPDEVAVFAGGAGTTSAFVALAFDHLFLAGTSEEIAEWRPLATRCERLTLDAGGKCPVIVGRSADTTRAAEQVLHAKLHHAGQLPRSPDHAFVHESQIRDFTDALRAAFAQAFPTLRDNPHYSSLVDDLHEARAHALLDDAAEHGAEIHELVPVDTDGAREDLSRQATHRVAPTFVLGATEEMRLLQEEVLAPILPILGYRHIHEVVERRRTAAPAPVLYYLGSDEEEERRLRARTRSAAFVVGEVHPLFLSAELPFGSTGSAGCIGGRDGFDTFSHRRAVAHQSRGDAGGSLRAPYGRRTASLIRKLLLQ